MNNTLYQVTVGRMVQVLAVLALLLTSLGKFNSILGEYFYCRWYCFSTTLSYLLMVTIFMCHFILTQRFVNGSIK